MLSKKLYLLIALIPALLLMSCSKKAKLSSEQSDLIYIRNKGADMPAYIHGNAASKVFLVILHGGPGDNGLTYRFGDFAEQLENEYAVVYWDQRGQGMSQGNYDKDAVSVSLLVDDVLVLLKTLKARYGNDISLFLMGHSWGGTLGTAFVTTDQYQHELKGWIEVDGAHDLPMLNKEAVRMLKSEAALQVGSGANSEKWQEILDYVTTVDTNNIGDEEIGKLNSYGHEAGAIHPDVNQTTLEGASLFSALFFNPNNPMTSLVTGGQTASLLEEELFSLSLTGELHKIQIPTLLLWGKYDFVVPPALAYSAYAQIGSSQKQLLIFDHSAHSPMLDETQAFVAALKSFITAYK